MSGPVPTMAISPTEVRPEPASFRDPANRVFHVGDEVLRGLDTRAAEHWRALTGSRFFPALVAAGKVCATEDAPSTLVPAATGAPWAAVLRHERIPFVSHPYEWSFSMLRDAALLHVEILRAALGEGFTTKDGSAYNLQWHGTEPVFIDIGSFEPVRDGEAWAGYRQFCQTMLYPLMLTAHLGVDFQPWLRARVDGIEADELRPLFGGARRLRPGVLTHLHLHGAMQQRNAAASTSDVRDQLRAAGFSRELLLATVRGIEKLVRKLDHRPAGTHWSDYQRTCGYSARDRVAKEQFVASSVAAGADPAWCSTSAPTTAGTPGWRPGTPTTWSPSSRTRPWSTSCTASCAPRGSGGSCHWCWTSPTRHRVAAGGASSGPASPNGRPPTWCSPWPWCTTWRSGATCRCRRSSTGWPG